MAVNQCPCSEGLSGSRSREQHHRRARLDTIVLEGKCRGGLPFKFTGELKRSRR